jgi:hypothetical protein
MKKIAWIAAVLASATVFVAATHNAVTHGVPLGSVTLAEGDSVVIPFIFRGNHVLVRGAIGDSDSLWFFVDSGAGSHCINRSRADKLGMKVDGGVEAMGAGGKVQAGAAHDVKYRLPGLAVDAEFAAAIDLDPIALQIGVPVDGILGYPLFKQMVVTVDYDRSVLVLRDPKRYKPAGAALPLTFHENHPYVNGRLTLAGRKPIEGSFILDTGSALALALAPSFVEKNKALETAPKTIQVRLGGVGGRFYQPVGRVERLELGPYALDRPVAVFAQPGPGHTSTPGSIGNIGGDVLQRFRVTFDYPHERLYLAPSAAFANAFETDMTGLTLDVRPEGKHAIAVERVEPGSPGATAGIAAGDIVESVDGRPLAAADLAALKKRTKVDGQALRLGLLRGTERSEVTLTTRRMI